MHAATVVVLAYDVVVEMVVEVKSVTMVLTVVAVGTCV